jgi:hypothetical protein
MHMLKELVILKIIDKVWGTLTKILPKAGFSVPGIQIPIPGLNSEEKIPGSLAWHARRGSLDFWIDLILHSWWHGLLIRVFGFWIPDFFLKWSWWWWWAQCAQSEMMMESVSIKFRHQGMRDKYKKRISNSFIRDWIEGDECGWFLVLVASSSFVFILENWIMIIRVLLESPSESITTSM